MIADAVRVERIGDLPSMPEIRVSVDGTDVPDGTGFVDYGTSVPGSPVTRVFTVQNIGAGDLTLGTISVPAGYSLTAGFGQTTLGAGH